MGKAMPDSKHLRWDQDVGTETEDATGTSDESLVGTEPAANDADGWQPASWCDDSVVQSLSSVDSFDQLRRTWSVHSR